MKKCAKKGLVKFEPVKPVVALQSFIKDPINNPLKTPSGKIEIYSTKLAQMQKTWKLKEGQQIVPIPVFESQREGILDPLKKSILCNFLAITTKAERILAFGKFHKLEKLIRKKFG
ncbi:TPA: hypothetical protein ACJEZV_001215 [Campylobacter jejuni]|uniref:hypothetical protein n=1 Tax=Campylobacter TaxID=194 RepID=UPI00030C9D1D|nr:MULTISPECIES: hypothetical protein [Campylobacter]AXL44261.1 hypothetical protein AEI22_07260 [Campylobacter jejuni]KQK48958.1 hypothetical protein APV25_01665 [Campylobacter jejuni]KQK51958.1 hypothetical protein APV24_00355 [Campylobacter jejuni]MCH3849834.1 hypothetical protein [Campylobacter jejuni]MCH3861874.1 hypothetical protein [Campylobacter jejuni]